MVLLSEGIWRVKWVSEWVSEWASERESKQGSEWVDEGASESQSVENSVKYILAFKDFVAIWLMGKDWSEDIFVHQYYVTVKKWILHVSGFGIIFWGLPEDIVYIHENNSNAISILKVLSNSKLKFNCSQRGLQSTWFKAHFWLGSTLTSV